MPDEPLPLLQFLDSQRTNTTVGDTTAVAPTAAPAASATPNDAASLLAPLAKQALASAGTALSTPRAVTLEGNRSWFDRNQRQDEQGRVIPIDTEQGINLGEFSRMVWQRRPEERLAVLRKLFPNSVVRRADTGDLIVETQDPDVVVEGKVVATGAKRDVLVNPPGLNAEDLLETMQQSAAPTVGGAIGLAAGQALGSRFGPVGSMVGKIAGAAVGSGVGGALEDLTARGTEGLPLDLKEIATEQSKQAGLNALFDFGLWGGAKSMRILSPFATTRGPAQFDLEGAKRYFNLTWGKDFKTTAAEESGSEALARLERTESQLPGASGVLRDIYKKTQQDLSTIFETALGQRVPEEQLGRQLMTTAKRELVAPAEQAVKWARDTLVRQGETDLARLIDSIAPGESVTKERAGELVRAGVTQERDAAKTLVDDAYAAVRRLPGGTGKVLPGSFVADAANAIEAELPKAGGQVLKSGVPAGLLKTLSDMKALRNKRMSLDELTTLKNAAYDAIAATEAVPGVKDRWFGKVATAYDDAIDKGVESVGAALTYPGSPIRNTALADALRTAKDTYKTKLLPFDRVGLSDVMRTPYEAGFKSPEQLVNRLFSGEQAEHNYRVLGEALGVNSAPFNAVRRSVLDGWLSASVDELTGRINPETFASALAGLRASHPQIYADVMRGKEQQFAQAVGLLRVSGKELRDVNGEELAALFRSGSVTASNLQRLMDAQGARDTLMANAYLKDLSTSKPSKVQPVEFVRALFNSDIETPQLQAVLSKASPEEIERLQAAALYRITTKAGENNLNMGPFLRNEPSPIQGHAMANALGVVGSKERARNDLLLGPANEDLVRATIALLGPREMKTGLFKAAGSMAATGMLEKLLSMPLSYAQAFAKKAAMAIGYTSEPVKKLLINQVEGPMETAAFANALIASEPFIKELRAVFGQDSALAIVGDLKQSIDKFVQQDTQPSAKDAQMNELIQFLRTGKGSVKQGVK